MKPEEALEINKTLRRRLIQHRDFSLWTAKNRKINSPEFIYVNDIRVVNRIEASRNLNRQIDEEKPFSTQLGKGGLREISRAEARLILGYDFYTAADDWDIQAMLEAGEGGLYTHNANAYFLGESSFTMRGLAKIPVAYFKIHERAFNELIFRT